MAASPEKIAALRLEHVNIKLLIANATERAQAGAPTPEATRRLDRELEALIPIFHGWIQGRVFGEELLLDIADYRHVPAGPGIVLIGHEGNYSVDNTGNRLGVRYNRKLPLEGSNQDRLRQAARAALAACLRLEAEPLLEGKLRFGGREVELFFNDRLLTPNTAATREAAQADLAEFFGTLFGGGEYSLSYDGEGDRRKLFAVAAKVTKAYPAKDLLANLAS